MGAVIKTVLVHNSTNSVEGIQGFMILITQIVVMTVLTV